MNGDNLNNIRPETNKTFRNKKRKYPHNKTDSSKHTIKTKI
jgi:hypothetical protein